MAGVITRRMPPQLPPKERLYASNAGDTIHDWMQSSTDFTRRIPQLDGLRGVAITMVVVFHYVGYAVTFGAPSFVKLLIRPTSLGWSGVDLFFVLSGFLIGGILLDARDAPNYFRVFYRRRACRILPLYAAFLASVLGATYLSTPPASFVLRPPIPWLAAATFCQNFWMAIHNNMGPSAVNPTWSLAVEEQFYLTLPALVYFVKPSRLIWIVIGGVIAAPLVRLGIFLVNPSLTVAMYVLLPCRMNSLLIGVAAAYFVRRGGAMEALRARRRELWTAIEVLTVICGLLMIRADMFDPFKTLIGYDCFGLLYACVLVTALVDEGFAKFLQAKWLMGLGSIAYGLYLIHPLVFVLTFYLFRSNRNGGAIAAIVSVAVTILIAKASWEWFEKPFVKRGHREGYIASGGQVPPQRTEELRPLQYR